MRQIHPTAIVDATAEIDENVEIGPYCVVGPHVEIGAGTRLHNHVTIVGPTTVGRDNEIYPFSVIGADPQDLKYRGEAAALIVGDRNVIREQVTIHRGTRNGGGVTRVGHDNLIMVAAHIAHDCAVGSNCVIANQVMVGGHAVIEDGVNIGGGAGIHHFTTVGTLSFVSGLCRVKKDVPPYMKVEGDPVMVRGVNTIALTRRQFAAEEIAALKDAYKRLFHRTRHANGTNGHGGESHGSGGAGHREEPRSMAERIEEVLLEYRHHSTVVRLCESLRNSANGVHGRWRETAREDSKFSARPVEAPRPVVV